MLLRGPAKPAFAALAKKGDSGIAAVRDRADFRSSYAHVRSGKYLPFKSSPGDLKFKRFVGGDSSVRSAAEHMQ